MLYEFRNFQFLAASNEPLCDVICGASAGGDIMTCCRDRGHQDGFCDFASAKCA